MTFETFLSTQRPDDPERLCARVLGAYVLTAVLVPIILIGPPANGSRLLEAMFLVFLFFLGGLMTGVLVFLPISLLWYALARLTGENLVYCAVFGALTSATLYSVITGFPLQAELLPGIALVGIAGGVFYWLLACGKSPKTTDFTHRSIR